MTEMVSAARRVLVISSELPPGPGGIGTHAFAVATQLAAQGREVRILGSQHYVDDDERAGFNRRSPVAIDTLPDRGGPVRTAVARGRAIREAIDSEQPDVIVASGGRVLWLTAPIARREGVPLVAVAHGTELGGPRWQRTLTRRALDQAAGVVAVSEFTARLVRGLGVATRVEVIPNGADGDRFAPDPVRRERFRRAHGLGDGPVLVTVGNVTRRKGQHLVVEALPQLVARFTDLTYALVGRPTDAGALRSRAEQLGVAGHLRILGQLDTDEVTDAHAAADVFAMTSTSTPEGDVEGYGIAVVEAALSGAPAVVTEGTGAEEAVVDGETGLAVHGDPESIADAIGSLLEDPERRRRMGQAAEHRARAEGTWAHRARRYGEVLDGVAAGSKLRIVVVSHTEHWRADDGSIVGFGATTRELDQLATLASELVHVAPLHEGPPPGMALPARAPNVRYVPVHAVGGATVLDKVRAVAEVPRWWRTISGELRHADVVHVRCPAGISMVALLVLRTRRNPSDRWVKYAGNWQPTAPDALSYRLQRWWLRRGLANAAVTVNGEWPGQPAWVRTFDNPTLTDSEIQRGRAAAGDKPPGPPWSVVFSGRLEKPKGAHVAVETVSELRRRGLDVTLDLVGDGPLRPWVEDQIAGDPSGAIRLHGWMRRDELEGILAGGHVMLLATTASEGFPKVLAEAMAFGCVPVASPTSSIGQVLGETGGAVVVEPGSSWTDAVQTVLVQDGDRLRSEGLAAVQRFSYSTYLSAVRQLAAREWRRRM